MKGKYRVIAFLMAFFLIVTLFSGVIGLLTFRAYAAEGTIEITSIVIKNSPQDATEISRLRSGSNYYVEIEYEHTGSGLKLSDVDVKEKELEYRYLSLTGSLRTESSSKGTFKVVSYTGDTATIRVTFTRVTYNGNSDNPYKLKVSVGSNEGFSTQYAPDSISELIPSKYLSGSSGGSGGSDNSYVDTYSSDIAVENVIIRDKQGNEIKDKVTEDTPAFDVEIVYTDFGENMDRLDREDLKESTMQAFLTAAGGFVPTATTRGSISVLTTSTDYPRFSVRFTDLTYEGGGNTVTFRVVYQIDDQTVSSTATATAYRVTDDDEEDDEVAPPTPYIIISAYSYGGEAIEAGQEFQLDVTYQNTSADINLENIVMTVTPDPENLSIAAASNTFFIESLPAGSSRSAAIDIFIKADAKVGSHEVKVEFKYEYVSQKERKDETRTESIAIPVTQIDRFAVEPITEMSDYVNIGDEGYVTIEFINRGKSTTNNISAYIKANLDIIAPSSYFGNLDSQKSDSLDVVFIPQEPGDLYGEVIIQYEDNNGGQKELSMSFTAYVEEPYVPPMDEFDPFPGMEGMDEGGVSVFTIIFCVIGGLLMAGPTALYLMKRVQAKGSEDFDEDF